MTRIVKRIEYGAGLEQRINVKVHPRVKAFAEEQAAERGITLSRLVRVGLEDIGNAYDAALRNRANRTGRLAEGLDAGDRAGGERVGEGSDGLHGR